MVNSFNLILSFLTAKLQLLILMTPVRASFIKDTRYESAMKYPVLLDTSMLKIWINFPFPKSTPCDLCRECCRACEEWSMEFSLVLQA